MVKVTAMMGRNNQSVTVLNVVVAMTVSMLVVAADKAMVKVITTAVA